MHNSFEPPTAFVMAVFFCDDWNDAYNFCCYDMYAIGGACGM